MWTHQQTIYCKLIEQNQCALILMCPIKKSIQLPPTDINDTANKSYVDGVKQAATLGSYLYTCLIIKWVMIIKMKPNSDSQDQNMQFPIIYISYYTVRN